MFKIGDIVKLKQHHWDILDNKKNHLDENSFEIIRITLIENKFRIYIKNLDSISRYDIWFWNDDIELDIQSMRNKYIDQIVSEHK